jgi:hypothetical protein
MKLTKNQGSVSKNKKQEQKKKIKHCLSPPDIKEYQKDESKKGEPRPPADTRALCHSDHTIKGTAQFDLGCLKIVLHVAQ